jgi:DNA-binding transcriptional ArsR family regulator
VLDEQATGVYAHLFQRSVTAPAWGHAAGLVKHIGLAQSTVSKHLSFLLECKLVTVRPDGHSSWYCLAQPSATAALITAAEGLLNATGTNAALCAHLSHPEQV